MGNQLPGWTSGLTVSDRKIMWAPTGKEIVTDVVLDGTYGIDGSNTGYTYDLRAGCLLAMSTVLKKYVPVKRTRTKTFASSGTSSQAGDRSVVPVDNAAFFRVGDTISVVAPSGTVQSSLTITAINYTTNQITVDEPIIFAADSAVYASGTNLAGMEIVRGILLDFVRLRTVDNTAAADVTARMLVNGGVNYAMLLGDYAACRAWDTANPTLASVSMLSNFDIFDPSTGTIIL